MIQAAQFIMIAAEEFLDVEQIDFLADSVQINELDMDGEFRRVAADLAFWNGLYAEACKSVNHLKSDLETREGFTILEIRDENRGASKSDKLTVDEVKARVLVHEDVKEAREAYIEAEGRRVFLKGVVDAVIAKKDMLQSLGAKLRIEMQHDPVVRRLYDTER